MEIWVPRLPLSSRLLRDELGCVIKSVHEMFQVLNAAFSVLNLTDLYAKYFP